LSELVPDMLADDTLGNRTLGEVLDAHCDYFAEHLVLPLVSAVWSCGAKTAREYPVRYLLRFLDNHGVLPTSPALRWRTVVGGSRTYVEKIAATLSSVQVATPVRAVRRTGQGVEVHEEGDRRHSFDRAVLAVHPHEALRVLTDATAAERQVLQAIPYLRNSVVLHTDRSVLPSAERNRASWNNRRVTCEPGDDRLVMHYYLNRLQHIDAPVDYIATLGADEIKPESVLARMVYEHPVYTPESVAARQRLPELSGGVLAFAGAYHGWGFHEDGCLSGVLAAQALGVRW
jgi:predicted NAD/FAD-binding protein